MADLTVGYQVQLVATVTDKYGNLVQSAPFVTWSVDGTVASVNSSGLLVAGTTVGNVVVSAAVDTITGTLPVSVVADVAAAVAVAFSGTPTPVSA